MKVALLEDNAEQAELVSRWLNERDISVNHHPDCRSFLDAFRKDLFDLAILDWELPDQTGIDVLRQLRVVQGQTLPIIFTTQRQTIGHGCYLSNIDQAALTPQGLLQAAQPIFGCACQEF